MRRKRRFYTFSMIQITKPHIFSMIQITRTHTFSMIRPKKRLMDDSIVRQSVSRKTNYDGYVLYGNHFTPHEVYRLLSMQIVTIFFYHSAMLFR